MRRFGKLWKQQRLMSEHLALAHHQAQMRQRALTHRQCELIREVVHQSHQRHHLSLQCNYQQLQHLPLRGKSDP